MDFTNKTGHFLKSYVKFILKLDFWFGALWFVMKYDSIKIGESNQNIFSFHYSFDIPFCRILNSKVLQLQTSADLHVS